MAAPVWVLSVDLQTKTASFQTGLAEAARTARSAFSDIGGGAGEMAEGVAKGSIDVRHSLGLVDNVIRGAHAQAMADLVRMYSQSAIVMAALPVAAAVAGLALIGGIAYEAAEHINQLKKEAEQLNNSFMSFDTTANNVFNGLDDKILKAEQKTDELRGDHVDALRKELELIDHQDMSDLLRAFEEISKGADDAFKNLQSHWYTFGQGSSVAQHSLKQFQEQYANLLSNHDEKGASGLLSTTLAQSIKIRDALQSFQDNAGGMFSGPKMGADAGAAMRAAEALKAAGYSGLGVKDELASANQLVETLQRQAGAEERINTLKKDQSKNAVLEAHKSAGGDSGAAAREAAESQMRINEKLIASEKVTADAWMTIHRASLEQRLTSDFEFAGRERDAQLAGNAAEIAALDRSGKDYGTKVKELKDKALEVEADYNAKVAELNARASVEMNTRDVAAMQAGEKAKIAATKEGSSARLAALDSAIKEEQASNLQDSSFTRELMNQRITTARQAAQEEAKLKMEAAKESASNAEKMGELQIAAEKQAAALADSSHRMSMEQRIAEETKFAAEEYNVKKAAIDKQIALAQQAKEAAAKVSGPGHNSGQGGSVQSEEDAQNKLKELQDKETQMTVQHENEITAIKEKAQQEQNQSIMSGWTKMSDSLASGMTKSLMGQQSWGKMMVSIGDQVVSGMIENAIKSILADDMTKEHDAARAARSAYIIGTSMGGPAGIILGPVFAAAAFSAQMAFADGGVVPGVGNGDIVPAMLEPGEGVVPKGVMEGLSNMARNGSMGGGEGSHTHVHVSPTYHVSALDSSGMKDVLDKHSDLLHQHFTRSLRKMNR